MAAGLDAGAGLHDRAGRACALEDRRRPRVGLVDPAEHRGVDLARDRRAELRGQRSPNVDLCVVERVVVGDDDRRELLGVQRDAIPRRGRGLLQTARLDPIGIHGLAQDRLLVAAGAHRHATAQPQRGRLLQCGGDDLRRGFGRDKCAGAIVVND
jgi:hypothetical protein